VPKRQVMADYFVIAYIDPGTGSYLLQIALAGLLGAGYALRHFWAQVRRFVARPSSSRGDEPGR
jgi:hypothetical protein